MQQDQELYAALRQSILSFHLCEINTCECDPTVIFEPYTAHCASFLIFNLVIKITYYINNRYGEYYSSGKSFDIHSIDYTPTLTTACILGMDVPGNDK
jgi:hypothetical protein